MERIHRGTVQKKKNLNDPDNHKGVVFHSEPNILNCEVKWALGSTVANKASGGEVIPTGLLKSSILNIKLLHQICQQIWKIQQWPQDWKRSFFIPMFKKGSTKECSNHHTIALISHARKVIFKILQARLQN